MSPITFNPDPPVPPMFIFAAVIVPLELISPLAVILPSTVIFPLELISPVTVRVCWGYLFPKPTFDPDIKTVLDDPASIFT